MRINIAVAGGSCTGKSTLAAALFARLKELGFDYDLVTEESRKLRREFGYCQSPFERLYLWRQQEREELRSTARDGFVTDTALFQQYVKARDHAKGARDQMAVRELFRMCMEIENRYQLIVMAQNPLEFPYRTDTARSAKEADARRRHDSSRSFVEHFWPDKVLFVKGGVQERVATVLARLRAMRNKRNSKKK